jgi:hypothetical protein
MIGFGTILDVMKSHIGCEIVWICVYKVDAILILQADFIGFS